MCVPDLGSFAPVAFWSPGPAEMLLLAIVALLLYGGQLPEVARSWGKTFSEFRRGLTGIQSEINEAIYAEPERLEYQPESPSYADDSRQEAADDSDGDDDPDSPERD